eukprot:11766162-Ditylum_brightwellii.AAC.1
MTATLEQPPLAPLTVWGDRIENIRDIQAEYRKRPAPGFAPTIRASDVGLDSSSSKEQQIAYFKENATAIKQMMQDNSAVVFREFSLMKEQDGF